MSRYTVGAANYKVKDHPLVKNLDTGVSNVNGTLASMTPEEFEAETGESSGGLTVQKYTPDAAGANSLIRISTIGDVSQGHNLGVMFFIPFSVDLSHITDFRFQPAITEWSSLVPNNPTSASYLKNGWNYVNYTRNACGGDWNNISGLQLRFNADAAGMDIYFIQVTGGGRSVVNVLMMNDDGSPATYPVFYTELHSRGLVGTIYQIIDNIGASNITEAQLQTTYDNGFDIGMHDTGIGNSYVPYTTEQLYGLWDASEARWRSNGWTRGIGHLAYVGGDYDQHVYEAAKNWGMKTARLTREGYNHIVDGVDDILMLRTHSLSTGGGITTAAQFEAVLRDAIEAGAGLVGFLTHYIGDGTQIPVAEYQGCCDVLKQFVREGSVRDVTISQAYSEINCGINRITI